MFCDPFSEVKLSTARLHIRPLQSEDLPRLREFTDRAIGLNYYSLGELQDIYARSKVGDRVCSLVLVDDHSQIFGVRITYPPGQWKKGKGEGLKSELWPVSPDHVAYFQSLFISPELTGQGWGKKMSLAAIQILKELGAQAIITHSWKESPDDSSGKYLRSLGFKLIATHKEYWKKVDYNCTRCGRPCVCTAEEMILIL